MTVNNTKVAYLLYDIYLQAERVTFETDHEAGNHIQNKVNEIRKILFPTGDINETSESTG